MNILFAAFTELIMLAVCVLLGILLAKDRKRAAMTESRLLNRIMAKDLTDLANNHRTLAMEPEDEKDILQLENDLAIKAAEIEREQSERTGIPIS